MCFIYISENLLRRNGLVFLWMMQWQCLLIMPAGDWMSFSLGKNLLCVSIGSTPFSRKVLWRWHTSEMSSITCRLLKQANFWQKTKGKKRSHNFFNSRAERMYYFNYVLTNVCQNYIAIRCGEKCVENCLISSDIILSWRIYYIILNDSIF